MSPARRGVSGSTGWPMEVQAKSWACSSSPSLDKALQRQRDSLLTLIPVQCGIRKMNSKTIKMVN